jgi:diguanylate cyclase (GGDEF)-like protein
VVTQSRNGERRGGSWWRAPMSRRDLDEDNQSVVINDAMGPFCGLAAVMFGIVSVFQFKFDATPGAVWSSALAALTGVFLAVSFLVLHSGRGDVLRRNPLKFGAIVTALVAANPMVYILGTGVTYPAIGMLLVIVALGALIHNRYWAGACIAFVDIYWILCAIAFGVTEVPPATFASQMIKANALAIVLNIARRRTVRRFETAQREVHRLATTDELTGLANQRGLYEVVRDLPGKLRKQGLDLTVVYVDVDDLKSVNDRYGHAAGDALIRSVGDVLRSAFREHDTIARVGGDEFAVLITSAGADDAEALVERAHQRLVDKGISASIGSASASPAAPDFDTNRLLERADAAMYEAKSIRKNGLI